MIIAQWLMPTFTGVIAISTLLYALFSYRLWRATLVSVELTRYSSFLSILLTLDRYAREAEERGLSEKDLTRQLNDLVAFFGFERLMEDVDIGKDKKVREFFARFATVLQANGIDPKAVTWLQPFLFKMGL